MPHPAAVSGPAFDFSLPYQRTIISAKEKKRVVRTIPVTMNRIFRDFFLKQVLDIFQTVEAVGST